MTGSTCLLWAPRCPDRQADGAGTGPPPGLLLLSPSWGTWAYLFAAL